MNFIGRLKEQLKIKSIDGELTERLVQASAANGFGRLPKNIQPDASVSSICGFCGTGCSLKVHLKDGAAVNLSGDSSYPVNMGMACPKGWESLTPLGANDRATHPLIRNGDGKQEIASWHTAALLFKEKFKGIIDKYGPGSAAFLSTGQIATEEMAFLGAFCKLGMGMLHGDGNTRQCMATAVTAYKESFGFDAPPFTYADFEESDVLVFVGANPCIAHPIMWQRVMLNKRNPEIVVIDPRKTETAMAATMHLPIKPKSDLSLFYGLAAGILDIGSVDEEFVRSNTTGFSGYKKFLQDYSVRNAAEASGIDEDSLGKLIKLIGTGKRVSFWWTMGVNQSYEGTRLAQAIINLALMTGNIGKPGTGANSITGQCNAMGSRMFSFTTSLPALRNFESEADRKEVADILKVPINNIPDKNSYAYHEILDAIDRGEIKGLWMIATNANHSWIQRKRFKELRNKLEFFVVQDMFANTDTAKIADLVLPAAGWGEKDGVFINSERRLGITRKVRKAPGEALSDFNIVSLLSQYWDCETLFKSWTSPEAVFKILAQLSKGRACDFSGITSYSEIIEHGGIQWPCPDKPSSGLKKHRRLFEDGKFYHKDNKARFIYEAPRAMPESPDEDFPFILLTGRGTSSQWHTQTRTGKSDVLRKLYPQKPYIEINPEDAQSLNISSGNSVRVQSRRGSVTVTAVVLASIQSGQVFMPMHYRETNELTLAAFDPYSKEPSYKACAVTLRPA